jgi:uncharacterized protein
LTNSTDIFDGLHEKLKQEEWPKVYLFKFIMPNEPKTISLVSTLFSNENEMTFNVSKTGKYTSLSIKELMLSAEDVIQLYKKASLIKGVISL